MSQVFVEAADRASKEVKDSRIELCVRRECSSTEKTFNYAFGCELSGSAGAGGQIEASMKHSKNVRKVLQATNDSAIDSERKRQQKSLRQRTWRANNPEKIRAIRVRYEMKHADKRREWHQSETAKNAARTRVRLWKAARHQFVSGDELRQCRADMRLAKRIRGPDWIVCLECGRLCKVLNRHLPGAHRLIDSDYRGKWGYKNSTGLISNTSAQKQRKNVKNGVNLKPKSARKNLRQPER